jgi:tyrosyl-tRNA synthetase
VERAEIRRNSEWLGALTMPEVLRLTSSYTVARMLERDDFQIRYREGRPISVVEFLYPLMQAMDSVAVRADVEMGGTDQTFNLLVGRDVQRTYGQDPQVVFTMPLLEGTDGVRKMSKSLDNAIALTDPPDEMFGSLMSIPDELIVPYLRLCTALPADEILRLEVELVGHLLNPIVAKRLLAREVVALYHSTAAALEAERQFDLVHRDRELPGVVREVPLPAEAILEGRIWLPRLLPLIGLATSNGDARRLMLQGAIRLEGVQVKDPIQEFSPQEIEGKTFQVGRRKFVRIAGRTAE